MGCSRTPAMVPTTPSASSVVIAGAISSMGWSTEKDSSEAAFWVTVSTMAWGSTP